MVPPIQVSAGAETLRPLRARTLEQKPLNDPQDLDVLGLVAKLCPTL